MSRVLLLLSVVISIQGQTLSFLREFAAPGVEFASGVAADASGVYVAVAPLHGGSVVIRKFDSSGNELWTRQIPPPAPGSLTPAGVFADGTGVYVFAGLSGPNGEQTSRFLRKYSPTGDELWTKELARVSAVTVHSTGVYVVNGRPPEPASVTRYTPAGEEVWNAHSENPNVASGIAVDSTGVYVIGLFSQAPGISVSMAQKFDLYGARLWTRQLPFFYMATFASAEPTGFHVATLDFSGNNSLYRFDSSGQESWHRTVANWNDAGPIGGVGVVADSSGVYVAGSLNWLMPPLFGQCRSGSGGDSFIRKYSPGGTEVWTRQFSPPDGSMAFGVAVNASGVFVAGLSGAAPFWEDAGIPNEFAPENRTSRAYLAKFEEAATTASSGPRILPGCVVNAASYVGGGVTPGEIVTIFGTGLGPSEGAAALSADREPLLTLADTRVLFNGAAAPMLYTSDKQVTANVPHSLGLGMPVEVQVEYRGVRSAPMTVEVLPSRPGIFTRDASGIGPAAALNADGSVNSPANPARRGSVITIFATGGGEGDVGGSTANLAVSLLFGGLGVQARPAEVLEAGAAPGPTPGLIQLKVRVPADVLPVDAVRLAISIGSQWTALRATVAVR